MPSDGETARSVTVTLDTDTLPVTDVQAVVAGNPLIHLAVTTVTKREVKGTTFESGLETIGLVTETWVLGESPLGTTALGNPGEPALFETLLSRISNGTFPKLGQRTTLSKGHRHQLRDAMILVTHVRAGRQILLTGDRKAFGEPGSEKRARIEQVAGTRIMGLEEFRTFCQEPRTAEGNAT